MDFFAIGRRIAEGTLGFKVGLLGTSLGMGISIRQAIKGPEPHLDYFQQAYAG